MVSRYLEALFYLRAERETVTNARLADWLGVSRPTVTASLRRMGRAGLIVEGGREIALTTLGEQRAAAIVRRHRIVERWLVDSLGMDWVAADEEAARLEHSISDEVEERLWESLGRPRFCPHGNPIPGHSEAIEGEVRLSSLGEGESAAVTRISEVAEREAPALLRHLADRGLVPAAQVTIRQVDSGGGTVDLVVEGNPVTISRETAERVWALPKA